MVRRVSLVLVLALLLLAGAYFAAGKHENSSPVAASPSPSSGAAASSVASADGWLAYQSTTPRGQFEDGVFLVRADGSQDHQIVAELPGRQSHPDFSRDGTRLAFDQLTSEESASEVYVADADGAHARRLDPCAVPKCAGHWEPAWSPDGKQIAVSTDVDAGPNQPPARFGIAIIDLAKRTERSVVEHTGVAGQDHFARWSPNGRKLVFWRSREGPGGFQAAVFVVRVDGTGLRRLTPWDRLAGEPDWSPAGRRIAFATRPLVDFPGAGQSELYTIRPSGTGLRRITSYGPNGPRATQPRWTPDGKAILYTRTNQNGSPRHIYVINADGTSDADELTAKPIYTHPVLQPTPK
jgi:Tol biopolymer transport system component